MSLKKTLVGAVAVASTLAVAGCGSAVDISGNQGASLSKSNFATALTQATADAKSVHISGTLTMQGQTLTVTADESFGDRTLTGVAADVNISIPSMGKLETRIVDGVVYVKGGALGLGMPNGKPWVKIDLTDTSNPVGSMLSKITDSMGPDQLIELLKSVSTVTTVGPETVDGVSTTHYKLSIDTSKLRSKLALGASALDGAALPKTVAYDAWLDASEKPVKVEMSTSTFSMELHFSKWGVPVHVVAPPASQVSPFSL